MALKGDLASVGLADVFQMLAHNQKVGILSIHGQRTWRALYFDRRGVTLYYNEQSFLDRLLESLVRRSFLALDLLDQVRRQNTGDPIGTVEALLAGGLIQEELFLESFRTQMEEEIYDLFLWENVHWEFLEGESAVEGRDGVVNENFFFSADSLIMEAARRLDEWVFIREQVPGPYEAFEPIPGYAAHEVVGLDELTLSILDLVDGKRSVARIVEISQITSFQVSKCLSILRQKEFIRPLPEDKLIHNANECIAEARLEDGIRLLERAVQMGAGLPDAHLLTAKAYEMQSEAARACWHYKCYSDLLLEAGRVDECVAILEHTTTLVPTDLEAWERLVHGLMQQSSPKLDAHSVGKDLTELYLELDETERACSLLEDLQKARPNDVELKKTLISVHTRAGDTKRVMELYESIADDLVAQKDPIGAVRYLQKILMIDRNRREVSDRIKQLYVLDEKHRSRRRRRALAVAVIFCLGTLGTLYYFYEQNVRREYEKLDAQPFIEEHDYRGAVAMYEDFLRRYPLSLSVEADVKRDIDRVKGMQLLLEEKRAAEARKKAAAARKVRDRYTKLWKQYSAMELHMSLALQRLEEIQKLAQEAGEPVDKHFLTKHKIELAVRTTRDYLATATRLEQQIERAWRAGDPDKARKLALQLHEKQPYTPSARRCRVPFHIVTEPPGAKVWLGDELVREDTGGGLLTPAWLRIPYEDSVKVKLTRDGYEDRYLKIAGSDDSPLSVMLSVKPLQIARIAEDPVTGIATGGTAGVLGLRGGRILAIDLASGRRRFERRLPELDEVHGEPLVLSDRVVFATTHGWLQAITLADGKDLWRTRVPGGVRTSIVAVRGSVVVGNAPGELMGFDVAGGDRLWTRATGEPPASDPVWDGARLWYARADLLLALDVEDAGHPILEHRDAGRVVGQPVRVGNQIAVLTEAGDVVGWRIRRRTTRAWTYRSGTSGAGGYLLGDSAGFVVVSADGHVRRCDPTRSGPVLAERRLDRTLAGRPLRTRDALFFVLEGDKGAVHVTSLSATDLSMRWNYAVPGGLRGQPTIAGGSIYLVDAAGRMHVLQ